MQDRYAREQAFHNETFGVGEGKRFEAVSAFYSVSSSFVFYKQQLINLCGGGNVLEYGCGPGSSAFLLSQHAASVVGIDISDVAITKAETQAREEGLTNVAFQVMNAEDLRFPDSTFDLVCGSAILHHLDLRQSFAEISRVLKPNGVALFIEPLGHNLAINLYRRATPDLRTIDEHPLLKRDFQLAEDYFHVIRPRFFQLLTFLAIPFRQRSFFRRLRLALDRYDQHLFRLLPFMKWQAWQVVLEFSKPNKPRRDQSPIAVPPAPSLQHFL